MLCEICGKDTITIKISLNGNSMNVCNECKQFGSEILKRQEPQQKQEIKRSFVAKPLKPRVLEEELVPDFGERIKKAREKKGLTIKEFSQKVFEKESVMHKIELSKFTPSQQLVEKIESLLEINLKATEAKGKDLKFIKSSTKPITLGDLLDEKLNK